MDPERVVTPALPRPTPHLPPAFFNLPEKTLDSLDYFTDASPSGETLDALDDLLSSEIGHNASSRNSGLTGTRLDALDSLDSLDDFSEGSQTAAAAESKTEWDMGRNVLDELDPLESVAEQGHFKRNTQKPVVNELGSLDVLDTFPSVEGVASPLDSISQFNSAGNILLFDMAKEQACPFQSCKAK